MNRLVVSLLALLLLAAVCAPSASARLLVVDDDEGCADATFPTIQSAVDAAVPGDDIRVCAGTYREAVAVQTDRLKIVSRTVHAAVIQPPAGSGAIVNLSARGTLLRGFTIRGVQPGGECGDAGDGILSFGGATIDYNRIVDSACQSIDRGIVLDPFFGGPITLAHNEILDIGSGAEENATGIFAVGEVSIHSNVIRDTQASSANPGFGGHGIIFFGGAAKIQDNTIEDNGGRGIFANGFEQEVFLVDIRGNRVRRNGAGIDVSESGSGAGPPDNRRHVRVEGNGVFDNAGDGIRMRDNFGPGYIFRNRSLGNGGLDCVDDQFGAFVWKDNIGLTDSPPTLCRAP